MATKKAVSKKVAPAKKVVAKATPAVKTAPPAVKVKAKAMPLPASPTDKKSAIQKQIEALAAQMAVLDAEAVQDLKVKISDAKKVLRGYEVELEQLTGKISGAPTARRERRSSITDDALKDQIIKVMALHGKEGMNARELGEKLHQDPIRIRKYLKDNPKALKRTGAGPGTKLFLP